MEKEKKEIGIEKLIELLCEYEDVNNWYATYTIRGEKSERELKSSYMFDEDQDIIQIYIISKSYGFIKWLVENDKIDFEGMSGHGKIISYLTDKKDYKWNDIKEGVVLMLLSISDTPIEDLISYLK